MAIECGQIGFPIFAPRARDFRQRFRWDDIKTNDLLRHEVSFRIGSNSIRRRFLLRRIRWDGFGRIRKRKQALWPWKILLGAPEEPQRFVPRALERNFQNPTDSIPPHSKSREDDKRPGIGSNDPGHEGDASIPAILDWTIASRLARYPRPEPRI